MGRVGAPRPSGLMMVSNSTMLVVKAGLVLSREPPATIRAEVGCTVECRSGEGLHEWLGVRLHAGF